MPDRRPARPGARPAAASTRKPGAGRDEGDAVGILMEGLPPGPGGGRCGAERTGAAARAGASVESLASEWLEATTQPQVAYARLVGPVHIVKRTVAPVPGSDSARCGAVTPYDALHGSQAEAGAPRLACECSAAKEPPERRSAKRMSKRRRVAEKKSVMPSSLQTNSIRASGLSWRRT